MAVTVTLTDEIDVSRGDMFVHPANLSRVDQNVEAMLVWMAEEPLVPERQYFIKHTTNLVTGRFLPPRYRMDVNTLNREPAETLAMNEVGRCTLVLNRKVCFDPYVKNRSTGGFIVIDRSTNRTVGAGMIVDRATSLRFLEDHWAPDSARPEARAEGRVTSQERRGRLGQQPVTILLTGLSGSGKTSIAYALERRLFDQGHLAVRHRRREDARWHQPRPAVLGGRAVREPATLGRGRAHAQRRRAHLYRRLRRAGCRGA